MHDTDRKAREIHARLTAESARLRVRRMENASELARDRTRAALLRHDDPDGRSARKPGWLRARD